MGTTVPFRKQGQENKRNKSKHNKQNDHQPGETQYRKNNARNNRHEPQRHNNRDMPLELFPEPAHIIFLSKPRSYTAIPTGTAHRIMTLAVWTHKYHNPERPGHAVKHVGTCTNPPPYRIRKSCNENGAPK